MPSSRDSSEQAIALVVEDSTQTFLQQVLAATLLAIKTKSVTQAQPVIALGVMLGWWTDSVSEKVVEAIQTSWSDSFSVTLGGKKVVSPRAEAQAFHIAAVRDRLSRSALPEIPEAAFDQVRLSQSVAALQGWGIPEQSRDIAERLAWEPDKSHWKQAKADAEHQIDLILDPLGKPGSPARMYAHKNDPQVKFWQSVRAEAVSAINEDESAWKTRATRIARTEATAAWNSGALAAIESEGRTHKKWLATKDARTRDSHQEADGQVVPITKPFKVGESNLMMPGDPAGPPFETINCRCTLLGADDPHKKAKKALSDIATLLAMVASALETPSLTASAGNGSWRDQIRIPKGNGRRSGQWTFTPWKHLDDLVGLLAVLGEDQQGTQNLVRESLDALAPFDANGFDVRDPALADASARVADLLRSAPSTGDPSLDDALHKAAQGIADFAETDWSLLDESTDLDQITIGRVTTKGIWEGDLPGDKAINPDLDLYSSSQLRDMLQAIKDHPVQPSPSARRKRASYLKELNDRRDRDAAEQSKDFNPFKKPDPKPDPKSNPAPKHVEPPAPSSDVDTPVPEYVATILDKWVVPFQPGYGTETLPVSDEDQGRLAAAVIMFGTKTPELHRGANLDLLPQDLQPGQAVDFGAVSTSEDPGSALAYAENGDEKPILFSFIDARGINVQNRAMRVAGYSEQEWLTSGRFYVSSIGKDSEGTLNVTLSRFGMAGPAYGRAPLDLGRSRFDTTTTPAAPKTAMRVVGELRDGTNNSALPYLAQTWLDKASSRSGDVNRETPGTPEYRNALAMVVLALRQASDAAGPHNSDFADRAKAAAYQVQAISDSDTPLSPEEAKRHKGIIDNVEAHKGYQRAIANVVTIDQPSMARKKVQSIVANLRSQVTVELWNGTITDDDVLTKAQEGVLGRIYDSLRPPLHQNNFDDAVATMLKAVKERKGDDQWQETITRLAGLDSKRLFRADVVDPVHEEIAQTLLAADNRIDLIEALEFLHTTANQEGYKGTGPGLDVERSMRSLLDAARRGDATQWGRDMTSIMKRFSENPENPHWRDTYQKVFAEINRKWFDQFVVDETKVQTNLVAKYGSLSSEQSKPTGVIENIGMFYRTRWENKNCVLASTAYELRRRGIDAYPMQAKKGRSERVAHRLWFNVSTDDNHRVQGLKGRQVKARYRIISKHITSTYPPESRGTITAAWKGTRHGHIWNWERDKKGKLTFYDPQTGQVIAADREDYWREVAWDSTTTIRLDDKMLRADIEVMIAPAEHTKAANDLLPVSRKLTIMGQKRDELCRVWNAITKETNHPRIFNPGYEEWNAKRDKAEQAFWDADRALRAYKASPDVQRLKEIGDKVPFLDPTKGRLT